MANHVIGTSALHSVLPTCLGELRPHVLAALLGNSLFSEAEQLRANHFVHECEEVARLTRWHHSVLAEIARRAAATAHRRGQVTLHATLCRLCPGGFRGHRLRQLPPALTWVPGAPLPDRPDRRAGTFDRLAAARFQPAGSLTLTHLLSNPAR